MSDINTYIMHPEIGALSPEMLDRELSLSGWSRESARAQSVREGMTLTEDHWRVINYLREYYLQHGWPRNTHTMTQVLNEAFFDHGGTRFLYRLFPKGPLAQGSRLAGLPAPHNAENDSLGSVQ